MRNPRQTRLRILGGLVLVIGLLFVARLYNLQVQHGREYAAEGEKQYVSTSGYMYDRGTIYMQRKDGERVEAADIAQGWLLTINPQTLLDPEDAEQKIAKLYPTLDHDDFIKKASNKDVKYVEVVHRIPDDVGQQISALGITGVQLYRETWRAYPLGDFGGQVIGFVGDSGNGLTGQYGIERYYNDVLARNEDNVQVNYFAELFGSLKNVVYDRKQQEQGDIVLTLEPTVQSQLEHTLADVQSQWKSDQVGGLVMDAKTGAIYGMAAFPTFNLNDYSKVKDISVFRNPLVEDVFEMGSIIKPLTIAAGLDQGIITPYSVYNDVGRMTVNKSTFSNYDGRARGPNTPVQQILNQSLNTGVGWLTLKMGRDNFRHYFLDKYQIGQETGIDLPGEATGLVSSLHVPNRDIEYCTASFGQGFAITPINTAVALASLGNGGFLVTPHVMDEIVYKNGTVRKIIPPDPVPILKPSTSEDISRMLTIVVDKALLNGKARIPEYTVASKTGTAQIANSNGHGYEKDAYLHTFVAYAPAFNPRFIIFMFNLRPKHVDYASQTLGAPAMDLVKFLLNYYEVPPDRAQAVDDRPLLPATRPKPAEVAPAAPLTAPSSAPAVTSPATSGPMVKPNT